jgi:predicted GIY-YIG superfamily endonuclease
MATFSEAEVNAYLDARGAELLDPARRGNVAFDEAFRTSIPATGGVYAFFYGNELFYIGETTSLRQRLANHMRNPENHVLALKIARQLHDRIHGEGAAGSQKKFVEEHKESTRQWVVQNLQVAYVPLTIGRRELEERLCAQLAPMFNHRYPVLP